jgi:hypothetical protein
MHEAIGVMLFFAAVTSGLGISRQFHGYRVYKTWPFAMALGANLIMTCWFAWAAVWVIRRW